MAADREFKTLDGMRGVAALSVVMFHAEDLIGVQPAAGGYLAVDLFFVLSGFVIAYAYERRLLGGLGAWEFFGLRLVRFYPLYLAGLLLGAVTGLTAALVKPATALPLHHVAGIGALNAFFIPAPTDRDHNLYPLNVPAWSLFFELMVNLLYALAVRWLTNRALTTIAAISGAGLAFTVLIHGEADFGVWLKDLPSGVLRTIFSFTVGVLIYRVRPTWGRPPAALLLAALAGLLFAPVPTGLGRAAFDLGFIFLASPLLVAMGAAAKPGPALARVCDYVGGISFAIYALQYPVLWAARGATKTILPGQAGLLFAVSLLILLAGCPLVVRLYDEPMRRRLRPRAPLLAAVQQP